MNDRTRMMIAFGHKYGLGPYVCASCAQQVDEVNLVVHHVDEDRTNNVGDNIVPMHASCHGRHHHIGKEVSVETRRKISEGNRGKVMSKEARAKIAAATRGRRLSPEHREALISSRRGKRNTPEHNEKNAAAHRGKKASPATRRAIREGIQRSRARNPEYAHQRAVDVAHRGWATRRANMRGTA